MKSTHRAETGTQSHCLIDHAVFALPFSWSSTKVVFPYLCKFVSVIQFLSSVVFSVCSPGPAVLEHQLQLLDGSALSPFLSRVKVDFVSHLNGLYTTYTKRMG